MPTQPAAVVDASVVLKWRLDDERDIRQAVALRDRHASGDIALIAPSLMSYEVVNGLVVASRKGRISPKQATEAVEDLLALGLELVEVNPVEVLALGLRYNIAAYDAAYVALAESEDCDLWTGDRTLYDTLHARTSRVRWIGE